MTLHYAQSGLTKLQTQTTFINQLKQNKMHEKKNIDLFNFIETYFKTTVILIVKILQLIGMPTAVLQPPWKTDRSFN